MDKIFLILAIFLSSCTSDILKQADRLYREGKPKEALRYYQKYYKKNPGSLNSDYAAYMSGIINLQYLKCDEAKKDFEFIIKNHPQSKYYKEAYIRFLNCPNFIYSRYKKLYIGDSQSYGKNALEIISFTTKTTNTVEFIASIYAGKRLIAKEKKSYIISYNEVKEKKGNITKTIIKYPIPSEWYEFSNNEKISYNSYIVDKVVVKAGIFENCLKVVEKRENYEVGNYYAIDVGKILATAIYNNNEKRIAELIKYE